MIIKIRPERWEDIKDCDGEYQVSNRGRVKNTNYKGTGKSHIMKPTPTKTGYLRINLPKNGKSTQIYVHRLVAQAFIPNPNNLPEVNHIDEDKTNNRVDNLEWVDHITNQNHGTRNKRIGESRSEPVKCIETGQVFKNAQEVIDWLGYGHKENIYACCNHKIPNKSAYGYHWEYVEK